MFDLKPDQAVAKSALYRDLGNAAAALTEGESDPIANMANLAALLWQYLPDCNWTGFYRVIDGELVLGPFCGAPACVHIALGDGVCGTAAASGKSQVVPDVSAFAGHIACDAQTRSELVVPVWRGGRVIAVVDCDSPSLARFDEADRAGLEAFAAIIADRV